MTLKTWLLEAPFTLTLSAGFFGFFSHCGFLQALEAHDIKPARTTGSSAGALTAALWASGTPIQALADTLTHLKREDFWDPKPGLGLLKGQAFHGLLEGLLGAKTFESSPIPTALVAYNLKKRRTEVLDSGSLALGIRASSCFPGLLQPVRIQSELYLDGGIEDRPGFTPLSPSERVFYHHLSTRSPWRLRRSRSQGFERRQNMMAFTVEGIPRIGPFKLHEGRRAMAMVYETTMRALEREIHGDFLTLSAR